MNPKPRFALRVTALAKRLCRELQRAFTGRVLKRDALLFSCRSSQSNQRLEAGLQYPKTPFGTRQHNFGGVHTKNAIGKTSRIRQNLKPKVSSLNWRRLWAQLIAPRFVDTFFPNLRQGDRQEVRIVRLSGLGSTLTVCPHGTTCDIPGNQQFLTVP